MDGQESVCVIHVSDQERSNAFYRNVLGTELVPVGYGWAYRFGGQQLNLHGPDVQGTLVAKVPVRPGGRDLCFESPGPIGEGQEHLSHHGACTYRVCTRVAGRPSG